MSSLNDQRITVVCVNEMAHANSKKERKIMARRLGLDKSNGCTVIETLHGDVKLIRRAYDVYPTLITSNFSNLADCLQYVEKNRFEINIIYSGKRKGSEESTNSKGG